MRRDPPTMWFCGCCWHLAPTRLQSASFTTPTRAQSTASRVTTPPSSWAREGSQAAAARDGSESPAELPHGLTQLLLIEGSEVQAYVRSRFAIERELPGGRNRERVSLGPPGPL